MGDGSGPGPRYPAALAERDSNGVVWTMGITGVVATVVVVGLETSTKGALSGLDMGGTGFDMVGPFMDL